MMQKERKIAGGSSREIVRMEKDADTPTKRKI